MKKIFFITLFLFISCSTADKSKSPLLGVPSDFDQSEKESIAIDDQEYGPTPEEPAEEYQIPRVKRHPVISLTFGPGLNRSVGYSAFLKTLKKNNISANLVSGTGMGAVIAAHYASGKTPQKIEWLFFNFFNETRGKKPYSKAWRRSLEKIFLKEFENTKVQDLKIPLMIPVFYKKTGKIKNINRGNLSELLRAQFIFKDEGNYTSPLLRQNFNAWWMRKHGADIVIGVDALGSKLIFDEQNDLLKNLYGRILRTINREKRYLDLFLTLPFEEMPLDSEKKLPEGLQKTNEYGKTAVHLIQEKVNLFEKKE